MKVAADSKLLHVEKTTCGDRNADGTVRPASRDTLMNWVLMQSGGRWHWVVTQRGRHNPVTAAAMTVLPPITEPRGADHPSDNRPSSILMPCSSRQ